MTVSLLIKLHIGTELEEDFTTRLAECMRLCGWHKHKNIVLFTANDINFNHHAGVLLSPSLIHYLVHRETDYPTALRPKIEIMAACPDKEKKLTHPTIKIYMGTDHFTIWPPLRAECHNVINSSPKYLDLFPLSPFLIQPT